MSMESLWSLLPHCLGRANYPLIPSHTAGLLGPVSLTSSNEGLEEY
jgi:hypothetical protein